MISEVRVSAVAIADALVASLTLVPATALDQDKVGSRSFRLVPDEDVVDVGRSSSNPQKKLIAGRDNAWIDSPVMSRDHARIWASTKRLEVWQAPTEPFKRRHVDPDTDHLHRRPGLATWHLYQQETPDSFKALPSSQRGRRDVWLASHPR
jgi:hypothetical protein